jgi:hypothetical protein
MPVWARTKIVVQEDCYREKPERINMKYVGPNPSKLYYKVYELLKSVFRASDSDIQEEKYSWGKAADKEKFKVRWYLHKDMDMYTYLYLRFEVSGSGNEKTGEASIKIKPVMRTEYAQDTLWQRSLFYEMLRVFWHRIFYHKKREYYAEECRNLMTVFQRNVNEFFKQLREE